ncbi:MAG: hypothetical protein ABEI58_01325 [Candidatus Nanohaloarchaea archaeon]
MKGKASVKVPNGKLVQVEAEYSDVFKDVSITGDFFLEPPEALEDIQDAIEGVEVGDEEELVEKLESLDARMIGFEPSHIVEALREAVDG